MLKIEREVRWLVNGTAVAVVGMALFVAIQGRWRDGLGFIVLAATLYVPRWLYEAVPDVRATFKPALRHVVEMLVATAVLLNAVGYLWLFNEFILGVGYDTLVHLVGTVLITLALVIGYVAYRWRSGQRATTVGRAVAAAVAFGLAAGVVWEILEWLVDEALGLAPTYGDLLGLLGQPGEPNDTLYDLLADILGAAVAAAVTYKYGRALQHWHNLRDFVRDVRPRRRRRPPQKPEASDGQLAA